MRRRYQKGQVSFSDRRQVWLGRYYEDVARPDGIVVRKRPRVVLGTKRELPTRALAMRKMDVILARINDFGYRPVIIATLAEFAKDWREKVLSRRKPSTIQAADSHLDRHILPKLGKLRLDQLGPENQQVFVNGIEGASRKTVLNILATLSSMLTTAESWGYATQQVAFKRLVLPERVVIQAPYFSRQQMEAIFRLAGEPWRTLFIVLALTGMRAGEVLGLQWQDIDFERGIIQIRRSVWQGRVQSTKSAGSAAPVGMPPNLSVVLAKYRGVGTVAPESFLFTTRNGRPPSSNKVVEYRLWPILDALEIPRCGLHAFRHSLASLIIDAGFDTEAAQQQLRHSDARTTRGYIHQASSRASEAQSAVAATFNLDTVGPIPEPKSRSIN